MFTCSPYLDSIQNGCTALMTTARNGHLRIVELLIAANAGVNILDNVSLIDGVCVLADCVVECVLTITSVSEWTSFLVQLLYTA